MLLLYVREESEREQWCLLHYSASFQSLPPLPTIKLGPSGAGSQVGWFLHILGPCRSLQQTLLWGGSFSCCCLNPHRCFQSVVWGFISQCWNSGFRGLSPGPPAAASPASCSFAHPAPQSATSLGPPAATLPWVLSAWLPVSALPTGLDECFFFISLVIRLLYSSIFCQFWLVFVFKLLLSFFWLCEEAQCVYLHFHLGWKSWIWYCYMTFWTHFLPLFFLWTSDANWISIESMTIALLTDIPWIHTLLSDLESLISETDGVEYFKVLS